MSRGPMCLSGGPHSQAPRREDSYLKSALEGECQQVTVLFADVVGVSTLSERLDPEAVHWASSGVGRGPSTGTRRHDQPVHRRRGHDLVRGADHARGPCSSSPARATPRCTLFRRDGLTHHP